MQVNERDYREAMHAFRKKRGLLSRAYRAFKRDANRYRGGRGQRGELLLKAADVVEAGAQQGIKVGGIQRSNQIGDIVYADVEQKTRNADALIKELQTPRPSTLSQIQVGTESSREEEEQQHVAAQNAEWVDPTIFAQRRSMFNSQF